MVYVFEPGSRGFTNHGLESVGGTGKSNRRTRRELLGDLNMKRLMRAEVSKSVSEVSGGSLARFRRDLGVTGKNL